MKNLGFFEWVATTRRGTDNPRGDFVQDARGQWNYHKDEEACQENFDRYACEEAMKVYTKLRRQYDREFGNIG